MNRDDVAGLWHRALAWLQQSTGQPPRLTPWGFAADAILAVALTIAAVTGTSQDHEAPGPVIIDRDGVPVFAPRPEPPPPGIDPHFDPQYDARFDDQFATWWQLVLVALAVLPLATRRRFPLTSFWIIAIAVPVVYHELSTFNLTWTIIASVIAAYSAPMYSRYRNLALASVVVAALWVVAGNRDGLPGMPSGFVTFLLLTSVGLAANAIHTWRQRAQTLQQEQAVTTRLAVDRERARLARELHDVVSHNVSVMVIQAGAARKVMDTSPELAREALLAVEAGGRAAMTELRQVIGLLTVDTDGADLAPQPGLDQLPQLAARVRETGVPVTLTVGGTLTALPAGVHLAAYRVVQEALTNTVKHAAGAAVTIAVTGTAARLRVEVTDTGGAASSADTGSGRGLDGLRERLAVYGGTLTAGHRPTGGYRVVAVIPLTVEVSP